MLKNHFQSIGFDVESEQKITGFIERLLEFMPPWRVYTATLESDKHTALEIYTFGEKVGAVAKAVKHEVDIEYVGFDPCAWGNSIQEVEILHVSDIDSFLHREVICRWARCPGPEFWVEFLNWIQVADSIPIEIGKTVKIDITCLYEEGHIFAPESKKVSGPVNHVGRTKEWFITGQSQGLDKFKGRDLEMGFMRSFFPYLHLPDVSSEHYARAQIRGPVKEHRVVRNSLAGKEVIFMKVDTSGYGEAGGILGVVGVGDEIRDYEPDSYFEGIVYLQAFIVPPQIEWPPPPFSWTRIIDNFF